MKYYFLLILQKKGKESLHFERRMPICVFECIDNTATFLGDAPTILNAKFRKLKYCTKDRCNVDVCSKSEKSEQKSIAYEIGSIIGYVVLVLVCVGLIAIPIYIKKSK